MIGASRKRFLGVLAGTGDPVTERVPVDESDRLEGSLATAVAAMAAGVDMVRVA